MKLSSRDLYAIRKAQLLAERKTLVAQLAQHSVRCLSLEIERKYDLLGKDVQLDVATGVIVHGKEGNPQDGHR